MAVVAAVLAGCGRSPYSQDTPDEVIQSAKLMVENGEAKRLAGLIYAASDDERRLYNRLGVVLGNLQLLGEALNEKFPKEVAALKERAQASAAKGEATSVLGELMRSAQPQRARRRAEAQAQSRAMNDAITRLFADPYSFLADAEGKLSTAYLTDTTAAVTWDGKPVMPPLGLVLKEHTDGKWYVVPPSTVPGVSAVWPRTKKEFQIWDAILVVFDKAAVDIRKDVEAGRASSLEDVSRLAGEKALAPTMLVFYALGQLKDAQKREAAAPAAAPAPN